MQDYDYEMQGWVRILGNVGIQLMACARQIKFDLLAQTAAAWPYIEFVWQVSSRKVGLRKTDGRAGGKREGTSIGESGQIKLLTTVSLCALSCQSVKREGGRKGGRKEGRKREGGKVIISAGGREMNALYRDDSASTAAAPVDTDRGPTDRRRGGGEKEENCFARACPRVREAPPEKSLNFSRAVGTIAMAARAANKLAEQGSRGPSPSHRSMRF